MKQTSTTLPLSDTEAFSKLIIDYVNGDTRLKDFYSSESSLEGCAEVMQAYKTKTTERHLLVKVLKEQYTISKVKQSTPLISAIDSLLNETTFTVCTGHQLCLFTGPLYFIYKIVTTINLARELKNKYPANNFVPVYWMASEDHDFEEINHITVFEKQISWNYSEQRGPVGKLATTTLAPVLEELTTLLGPSVNGQALSDMFNEAYLKHTTLSEATRHLVHTLFGDYGLVVLDAADKQLKQLFIPFIKEEVIQLSNYKTVNDTITKLNNIGFKQQVNPRPINLFYMKDNLRERIEKVESGYLVVNTAIVFTEEELLQAINDTPEYFSPNVILRPLYQQVLLPNLAYIGGPGELAYWLELKTMFDKNKVIFPALWLRNSVLIIDAKSTKLIEKFNFTANDLFTDADLLTNKYMMQVNTDGLALAEEEVQIKQTFSGIVEKAQKVDITLKASVEAELQKIINALKTLENKLIKAEKQKNETTVTQIKKLKQKLFPQGKLQERNDTFIPFYLQYGKEFIGLLITHLNPLAFKFTVITISDD